MANEFSKEEVLKKLGKRIKDIRIAKGYTSYGILHMNTIYHVLSLDDMEEVRI